MLRSSIITTLLLLVSCSQSPSSDIASKESRNLEEKPKYDYASLDGLGQKSHYVAGIDYDIELKTRRISGKTEKMRTRALFDITRYIHSRILSSPFNTTSRPDQTDH